MSRNAKRELAAFLCLVLALAVFCAGASAVLLPKRHEYGATWGMYEKEPENTVDALFFGSSLVCCDLIPSVMYEESGITSYLMSGPDQRFPVTYRYLREACGSQSPKAVFIEATAMLLSGPGDSLKVNLAYMPWTENRLAPTFQEAAGEERLGLLFPLYAYHDRWDKLQPEDWKEGLLGYGTDPLAGYTFLDWALPMGEAYPRDLEETPADYEKNLQVAEQMVSFCRERGIEPVFFLAPCISQPSAALRERLREDLAGLGAEFWDCNEAIHSMGLDFSTDFFDELHFNYRGADIFSRYFSGRMRKLGLSCTAEETSTSLWKDRTEHFSALRAEWEKKPVRVRNGKTTDEGEAAS